MYIAMLKIAPDPTENLPPFLTRSRYLVIVSVASTYGGGGPVDQVVVSLEDAPARTGLACPVCHKPIAKIARVTPRGVLFMCPTCGHSLGGTTISY
jgi:hypothetical protein